jgi:hypothetical protein
MINTGALELLAELIHIHLTDLDTLFQFKILVLLYPYYHFQIKLLLRQVCRTDYHYY